MSYKLIDSFQGEYRFLSNFYSCFFVYTESGFEPDEFSDSRMVSKEFEFENTEQFFHWRKSIFFGDFEIANKILKAPNPKDNKALGRRVKGFNAEAWKEVSPNIMLKGLKLKFTQNPDLKVKLINTAPAILIEGNTWGDKFWGMVNGEGQNWLGILLMMLRSQLINKNSF